MQKILCPHCQVGMKVAESKAGQAVRCPKCEGEFRVPVFFVAESKSAGNAGEPFQPPSALDHERQLRAGGKRRLNRRLAEDTPPSKLGIASLVIGVCTVLDVTLMVLFGLEKPHWIYGADQISLGSPGREIAGILLLLGIAMAMPGIGLAVAGLTQKNCSRKFSAWGLALNGLPIGLLLLGMLLESIRQHIDEASAAQGRAAEAAAAEKANAKLRADADRAAEKAAAAQRAIDAEREAILKRARQRRPLGSNATPGQQR